MTGHIIRLSGDDHHQAQLNLPWYVNGRLDPQERAELEAHLGTCALCQADLATERRLKAEIAALPLDAEAGWTRLQSKLKPRSQPAPSKAGAALWGDQRWQGWAIAAQFLLLLLISATLALPHLQRAQYRALGGAPEAAGGNLVVIFQPDTPEKTLRGLLRGADAHVIDGPTEAGVYVLRVPANARAGLVKSLARQPEIVLAQPIDGTPQ